MFAYCGNNPVNLVDTAGEFWSELWQFIQTAAAEIGNAIVSLTPAYTGCGTIAICDGPFPFGDAIGLAGAALITIGAIGYGIHQAYDSHPFSKAKVDSKSDAIAIPRDPNQPVIFPDNPFEFNPIGLNRVLRPGTKNGIIIAWMDPLTNTEVFRWDENINYFNGPHYHIAGEENTHYYPGMTVPEPYATIYFPFG